VGGGSNVGVGGLALRYNTSGDANIGNGYMALMKNTNGSYSVAIGFQALLENVSGNNNTGVGRQTLGTNTTGSQNTAIGYLADVSAENLTNATAIGANATVNDSNKIRLGDSNVTVIEGQVAFTNVSDRRLKDNIQETKYGLNEILKLKPVHYTLKSNGLEQLGFIAQDVKPLIPEAVIGLEGNIEKGETLGITYSLLIPVLTKAIQQQQQIINDLLSRIEKLEKH